MTGSAPRRQVSRLSRERRVSDILDAARLVFAQKGYDDAVLSDIAERAGVVEGTIYRYFANKRDLLIKVVEHWYEEMLSADDTRFAAIRGTWNRLRFRIWQHLTTIREEPALTRLVFTEFRPDPGYRAMTLFDLNRHYTGRIVDVVREAMAQGEFRSDISPSLVRDLIFGCVEHHTWAFLRGEGDFSIDEAADGIADIVFRGLALHPGEARDPTAQAAARLEKVAERLEQVAAGLATSAKIG